MIIDKVHIAITHEWIEDVLKKRIEEQGINIEDLFLITHAVKEIYEGDALLETKYGKLRIFWRNDLPENKLALMCHRAVFNYPTKGTPLSSTISGKVQGYKYHE